MKKTLIILLVSAGILVGAFYALNAYIYNEKQADDTPAGPDQNPDSENGDYPWITYTDTQSGLTFQYPENILAEYISVQEWPPTVEIEEGVFSCAMPVRLVDDRAYCVRADSEGAAGSVYTGYAYTTLLERENKSATIRFALRAVQCANYDEPERGECEGERETFDVDSLADRIAQSIIIE